jgi:hypothetical protein
VFCPRSDVSSCDSVPQEDGGAGRVPKWIYLHRAIVEVASQWQHRTLLLRGVRRVGKSKLTRLVYPHALFVNFKILS